MSWIHNTVAEFGRQMGIDRLELGGHGLVQLQLGSGSLLAVEPVRCGVLEEVLVYLMRPASHLSGRSLVMGLEKAHFSQGGMLPMQLAVRGDGPDAMLLGMVRLPERAFTGPALMQAVDHVSRWLDDVLAA